MPLLNFFTVHGLHSKQAADLSHPHAYKFFLHGLLHVQHGCVCEQFVVFLTALLSSAATLIPCWRIEL